MNFMEIAQNRQSCRRYDSSRMVESEKIQAIVEAGRLGKVDRREKNLTHQR